MLRPKNDGMTISGGSGGMWPDGSAVVCASPDPLVF